MKLKKSISLLILCGLLLILLLSFYKTMLGIYFEKANPDPYYGKMFAFTLSLTVFGIYFMLSGYQKHYKLIPMLALFLGIFFCGYMTEYFLHNHHFLKLTTQTTIESFGYGVLEMAIYTFLGYRDVVSREKSKYVLEDELGI